MLRCVILRRENCRHANVRSRPVRDRAPCNVHYGETAQMMSDPVPTGLPPSSGVDAGVWESVTHMPAILPAGLATAMLPAPTAAAGQSTKWAQPHTDACTEGFAVMDPHSPRPPPKPMDSTVSAPAELREIASKCGDRVPGQSRPYVELPSAEQPVYPTCSCSSSPCPEGSMPVAATSRLRPCHQIVLSA